MTGTIDLPIPKCPNCRLLTRLLREARERIPDWQTGVNRELLAEIDAALEASHTMTVLSDGDLRMLGARDGLSHALIWIRDQIARIDGHHALRIGPRHIRKRAARNAVLLPLRELEARIAKSLAEMQTAYDKSRVLPESGEKDSR